MPKARLLGLAAGALLLAGCSSSSAPPVVPEPPASSTPPAASSGPCPDGSYLITEIEGRGKAAQVGKGTGGNITADFDSGTFTLSSDGSVPTKLDLGPASGQLRFNGQIVGAYEGEPGALRLTTKRADGDVSVKAFGITRSRSLGGLADQLIGQGATAQVTCDDAAGKAVVVLPDASLTLTKQ